MDEDPTELLRRLSAEQFLLLMVLIATIIVQWGIFGVNWLGAYTESTGLKGLGFKPLRLIDFAWAISFFLAALLILSGLAWLLAQVGLPVPGEVGNLIPKSAFGKGVWVAVSLTAAVCEEVAFRGYLMTRLRLLLKTKTWVLPTIISSVIFGSLHLYQGFGGFILIAVYGLLFSLLFIHTRSLWPCIIAHFIQDFGALFYPQ